MKNLFLKIIGVYKIIISPIVGFFGFNCRFYPSCSSYTADAIKNYGILKGGYKGIWRLLRCGPWSKGGIDYIK